jgi:hypothetical protein
MIKLTLAAFAIIVATVSIACAQDEAKLSCVHFGNTTVCTKN